MGMTCLLQGLSMISYFRFAVVGCGVTEFVFFSPQFSFLRLVCNIFICACTCRLTKSLAVGWAKYGIRVNCLIPGWIATDLTQGAIGNPVVHGTIVGKTPDPKGFGAISDTAGTACFLASSASDFVTGVSIPVDGGFAVSINVQAGL